MLTKSLTDEQCLEYIGKMRWPDGIVRCPECGEKNVKRVERSAESKNRRKWFYLSSKRHAITSSLPRPARSSTIPTCR